MAKNQMIYDSNQKILPILASRFEKYYLAKTEKSLKKMLRFNNPICMDFIYLGKKNINIPLIYLTEENLPNALDLSYSNLSNSEFYSKDGSVHKTINYLIDKIEKSKLKPKKPFMIRSIESLSMLDYTHDSIGEILNAAIDSKVQIVYNDKKDPRKNCIVITTDHDLNFVKLGRDRNKLIDEILRDYSRNLGRRLDCNILSSGLWMSLEEIAYRLKNTSHDGLVQSRINLNQADLKSYLIDNGFIRKDEDGNQKYLINSINASLLYNTNYFKNNDLIKFSTIRNLLYSKFKSSGYSLLVKMMIKNNLKIDGGISVDIFSGYVAFQNLVNDRKNIYLARKKLKRFEIRDNGKYCSIKELAA